MACVNVPHCPTGYTQFFLADPPPTGCDWVCRLNIAPFTQIPPQCVSAEPCCDSLRTDVCECGCNTGQECCSQGAGSPPFCRTPEFEPCKTQRGCVWYVGICDYTCSTPGCGPGMEWVSDPVCACRSSCYQGQEWCEPSAQCVDPPGVKPCLAQCPYWDPITCTWKTEQPGVTCPTGWTANLDNCTCQWPEDPVGSLICEECCDYQKVALLSCNWEENPADPLLRPIVVSAGNRLPGAGWPDPLKLCAYLIGLTWAPIEQPWYRDGWRAYGYSVDTVTSPGQPARRHGTSNFCPPGFGGSSSAFDFTCDQGHLRGGSNLSGLTHCCPNKAAARRWPVCAITEPACPAGKPWNPLTQVCDGCNGTEPDDEASTGGKAPFNRYSELGHYHVAHRDLGSVIYNRADKEVPPFDLSATVKQASSGIRYGEPVFAIGWRQQINLLYTRIRTSLSETNVYEVVSHDDGKTWNTEVKVFTGGKHPDIDVCPFSGVELRVAYVANRLKATQKYPGDVVAGTEFTMLENVGGVTVDLAVADQRFKVSFSKRDANRCLLTAVRNGESEVKHWQSWDDGKTWTLIDY